MLPRRLRPALTGWGSGADPPLAASGIPCRDSGLGSGTPGTGTTRPELAALLRSRETGVKRGWQLGFWKRQHMHRHHPHLHLHSPHGKLLGMAESPAAALEQTRAQQRDLSSEMGEAFNPAMPQARALQLSCLLRVQVLAGRKKHPQPHRKAWVGRHHLVPTRLPWAGMPPTRSTP